jgi:hypothetical protein
VKVGGRRNFGYGKRLWWAGKNALRDRYGDGNYGSRAAHEARWQQFSSYARSQNVNDAREVTRDLIVEYGRALSVRVESAELSVRYAQNLLSTVNVVLESMRADRILHVSPAELVGNRKNVRTAAPAGLDRSAVERVVAQLADGNEQRVALVAALARDFGLRFREASLLDARRALNEAKVRGAVNITAGTKGGRGKKVDRWVPVSQRAMATLTRAVGIQCRSPNLIPGNLSFRQWRDHARHAWMGAASQHGLHGFHDLRAAYACDRYGQLTGSAAPVVAGQRGVSKEEDTAARAVIAQELGHGRTDVLAAYVGSAR